MQANNKFTEAIKLNGGLNMDDHPANVPAGDFTMAINVRTLSSNNNSSSDVLPQVGVSNFGTLGTITPYFGTKDAFVSPTGSEAFNKKVNGATCDFYIMYCTPNVFNQADGLTYNILHVAKSGTGANELAIYRLLATIDNATPQLIASLPLIVGDISTWEIGKCISIGNWLFVIVDSIVYKIPNAPESGLATLAPTEVAKKYSLIKRPPIKAPIVVNLLADEFQLLDQQAPQNYPVVADQVQFCCTFTYFDGTETPIGTYSRSYPLLNVGNYLVEYPVFVEDLLSDLYVDIVNFYYKINDDGLWKKIGTYKNDSEASYPFVNYNPVVRGGSALATNRQAKYFEAIPYQSLRIENMNSKVLLANNQITTGVLRRVSNTQVNYVVTNESLSLGVSPTFDYTAQLTKSLKAGGRYRIGMFGVDEFNRPTYVLPIIDITAPRSATIDGSLVPAVYVINNGAPNSKIKQAVIPLGLLSYANCQGTLADYVGDANVKNIVFCATKCLNIDLFLEGVALFFYYYLPVNLPADLGNIGNYGRYILSDKYVETTTGSISGCTGIAIVLNGGEAYNWKQGDRLYVKTFVSANVILDFYESPYYEPLPLEEFYLQDFEIIEQIGNVLILDPSSKNWGLKYAPVGLFEQVSGFKQYSLGVFYEIYRPIGANLEGQPYYAFSEPLDFAGLKSGAIPLPVFQGDVYQTPYYANGNPDVGQPMKDVVICGGSALISLDTYPFDGIGETTTDQLHTLRINFWKANTSWNLAKPYDLNWNKRQDGWSNIQAPYALPNSEIASGHIIASNPLIQGGSLDGTGNFDSTDATILPYEMGGISEILRITDNQNQQGGSVLLAIGAQKTATIYVNRTVIQDVSGVNQISLSSNVFNTINILKEQYGCRIKDYKSIVRGNNNVYWFDKLHKKVVRYNLNGLTAVSDIKMRIFFTTFSNLDFTGVVAGYEYTSNSYYVSFLGTANDLKTVIWNEDYNRWAGFLDQAPLLYLSQGANNSFSFLGLDNSTLQNNQDIQKFSNKGTINYGQACIEFSINNQQFLLKRINSVYIVHNYVSRNNNYWPNQKLPFDLILRVAPTQFQTTNLFSRIGLGQQNAEQKGGGVSESNQRAMYTFLNSKDAAVECLDSWPIDVETENRNIMQFYAALLRINWSPEYLGEGIITPIVNIRANGQIIDTE